MNTTFLFFTGARPFGSAFFRERDSVRGFSNYCSSDRTNTLNYLSIEIAGDGNLSMRYLHTMIRASDLDKTLEFFVSHLGLVEVRRYDSEQGRFTLVFLAAPGDADHAEAAQSPLVEITYNWDPEDYDGGRNFGHLAYRVDNIYETCQKLYDAGVVINRPPRDGRMAFVKSPDGISIELLQEGEALPAQDPWVSMDNTGTW
jgi:lactoylglutathione lyase